MPTAAIVSFRLGGHDGVSVEAAKWGWALGQLGFEVRTVAGAGTADVIIAGLERAAGVPSSAEVGAALEDADVVVVENLLSLPLNPAASAVVASSLRRRPAVLRHHDLAWQRPAAFTDPPQPPPDDPCWVHVTINQRSLQELADHGIRAVCCHNRFPLDGPESLGGGDRAGTRAALGLQGPVLVHPVRAIARKGVPTAIALAECLGATYWLTGPAEDGYGGELARLLGAAACPVVHREVARAADAYAAADAVAFPSALEGFGNPVIESALARRPLAIGHYPVAEELAQFGFRWFPALDPAPMAQFLRQPDVGVLDHNEAIARAEFGLPRLPAEVAGVLERVLT